LTAFIFSDLNYKMVIFLSQTDSTPKHLFLEKKSPGHDTLSSEINAAIGDKRCGNVGWVTR